VIDWSDLFELLQSVSYELVKRSRSVVPQVVLLQILIHLLQLLCRASSLGYLLHQKLSVSMFVLLSDRAAGYIGN